MSFDRPLQILFNKIFVRKFECILKEIGIFEVGAFRSIKNIKYGVFIESYQILIEIFKRNKIFNGEFFATTYLKNTKNISFDEQSVELIYKIFPANFGSILKEI